MSVAVRLQPVARLYEEGRVQDAARALQALAGELGQSPDFHRLGGAIALGLQRPQEAYQHFTRAVQLAPGNPAHLVNLGEFNRMVGRWKEAADAFRRALALDPASAPVHVALGLSLAQDGQRAAASEAFARGLKASPGDLKLRKQLAATLDRMGLKSEAIACMRDALRIAPSDIDCQIMLRKLYAEIVPGWHFPMMNDMERNRAYDRAIRRAVRPGMHVLDIGTGAGLLSLMSARAGAGRVTTCEMVPEVAAMAQRIMDVNGVADRVRVAAKKSTDLVVGQDMADRADLLVSEVLSNDLLTEDVVETIAHARAQLLKPGAPMIPRAIAVVAALVGGDELAKSVSVGTVDGFDLSPFNEFSPVALSIRVESLHYDMLSDAHEVFHFDMAQDVREGEALERVIPVTRAGVGLGFLQWIRLYLDDEVVFENRPGPEFGPSGWHHRIMTFPRPRALTPGQKVTFEARHDRRTLALVLKEVR
jgi:type II protein arginine methyltransferase